jgi:PEP-CTERM motif
MKKYFLTTLIGAAVIASLAATPALADKGKNHDKSFEQLSQRNHGDDHKDKDKIKSWDSEFKHQERHVEYPGHIAAVPEPETYALMLAGLAAVVVVARRRKA